jgi:shikimate dehydrogenase
MPSIVATTFFSRPLNHSIALHYGIIGYPLAHSFSPAYFRKKFAGMALAATYETYPLSDISELPALLAAHPELAGLNVTLPFKEAVIPHLHELDVTAAAVGAVNCISIKDGRLKGYNTDVAGFEQSLIPLLTSKHTLALILGTGGSSKAVAYVLAQLGIPFHKVSASNAPEALTYDHLYPQVVEVHKLIINTTPLGMYPDIDRCPEIPYDSIGSQHLLYDLIYNPEETKFLQMGKERGAVVKNGFEMLVLQAEASWSIWAKQSEGLYIPNS